MSELEAPTLELPIIELIYEDGEPLESNWHRIQINLLIDVIQQAMTQRQRSDFFAGGNMFVYFSFEQARTIATQPPQAYRHFRGPDFFFVGEVDGARTRNAWVVWEEEGRYPDVIIELLSPSTAQVDKTTKKQLYERTFHTPEYFWYDPIGDELQGWRLVGGAYQAIEPDATGRVWSQELKLWLGRWQGEQMGQDALWLRFYDTEGRLAPTLAETERQRAETAEAEVARLRARLAKRGDE